MKSIDVDNIKEIVKRGPGQPTKYDPNVHPDMLIELFSQGASVVEYCCHAGICRQTFYNSWLKNPEFKYAYKFALQLAQVWWENYPLECEEEGKTYNFQHFFLVCKNRFGFSQIKRSKDGTVAAKLKAAWRSFTDGKLTAAEFNATVAGITGELRCTELKLKSRELDIRLRESEDIRKQREHALQDRVSKYSDNQLKQYFNFLDAVNAGQEVEVVIVEPKVEETIEQLIEAQKQEDVGANETA